MLANVFTMVALAAAGVSATTLHVNYGCILANDQSMCESRTASIHADSTALIYAKFSGNTETEFEVAGCVDSFSWPAEYNDVYFGGDDCLYDAGGNKISNQCCTTTNNKQVKNPYYQLYGKK